MKIRTDFVTNSSSSSFIFLLAKSPDPLKVQLEDLFAHDPEAKELVRQLIGAKKFSSLKAHLASHDLDHLEKRIENARASFARLNSVYSYEDIFEDWRERAALIEDAWSYASAFGSDVYEVEVGDESGNEVEMAIEQGEYNDYFGYTARLDNH